MLQKTGCIELHYKVQVDFWFFVFFVKFSQIFQFKGVYRRNPGLATVSGSRQRVQSLHESVHRPAAQEVRQLGMFLFRQLKLVLVVRSDLKLSKGKTASQAAHAAVMCFKQSLERDPTLASKWLNVGQPKIVLKVDSLSELESLRDSAKNAGIVNSLVLDAGRTQISPGTATCLGIGPDYDEKIDKLVKELKLL